AGDYKQRETRRGKCKVMRNLLFIIIGGLLLLSACGETEAKTTGKDDTEKLVIGYFPNLNHAPAIVAKEKELFEKELGDDVEIEYMPFSGGGEFMTELAADEIQGGLVGQGPSMHSTISGNTVTILVA